MRVALDTYRIAGVEHNISFLRAVMDNARFIRGDISTKFIPEEFPQGFHGYQLSTQQTEQLICAATLIKIADVRRQGTISGKLPSQSETSEEFEGNLIITVNDVDYDVEVENVPDDEEG